MNENSKEIHYYDKDGKTYWSCGCVSYPEMRKGSMTFVHEACGNKNCPVVVVLHKTSSEQGIPVEHWKTEDRRKSRSR